MMKQSKDKKRILSDKTQIKALFIMVVAAILLIALALVAVLEYLLLVLEPFVYFSTETKPLLWVFMFAAISVVIGLVLTFILGKIVLRPFNALLDGMTKLSEGEFTTRIDLGNVAGIRGISDKFNALAEELQKIEILRSDFVNNFSHELKTPIVSISSLIKLMKSEEIPREKQQDYLKIIEEEINRLADMTTNILNLTKIENQGILTDKTEFNLSEQIRTCVLILERKWEEKELSLDVDFDEYKITANDDMLKQVWINLIDNAIKFSKPEGELKIAVGREQDKICVAISNEGEEIPESDYAKIFQKFYQGDPERSKDGNGIGLSIVKHIIDLHGGEISVVSKDGVTTFTVKLKANSLQEKHQKAD